MGNHKVQARKFDLIFLAPTLIALGAGCNPLGGKTQVTVSTSDDSTSSSDSTASTSSTSSTSTSDSSATSTSSTTAGGGSTTSTPASDQGAGSGSSPAQNSCSLPSGTGSVATASKILNGYYGWDATGSSISGSLQNHGVFNLATTAFTSAGVISSFTGLSASQVCSTSQLFGTVGTANCITQPSLTLSGELNWGSVGAPSTKTLTISQNSTGTSYFKISFSGPGTDGFILNSAAGVTFASATNSVGAQVFPLDSTHLPTQIVSIKPRYVDGTTKTMTLTATYPSGDTQTVAANATFTNPILGLSSLYAYYTATSFTSLSDGDTVSGWDDSSGSSRPLTQSTSGYQPVYKVNIVNSQPTVRFDGNRIMAHTSTPTTGAQSSTIFAVVRPSSLSGYRHIAHWGSTSTNEAFGLTTSGSNWNGHFWASNYYTSESASTTDFSIVILQYTGSVVRIYVNGTVSSTGDTNLTLNIGSAYGLHVGSRIAGLAEPWVGDISELIITTTSNSSTEREAVECYLGSRYGITLGHGC